MNKSELDNYLINTSYIWKKEKCKFYEGDKWYALIGIWYVDIIYTEYATSIYVVEDATGKVLIDTGKIDTINQLDKILKLLKLAQR